MKQKLSIIWGTGLILVSLIHFPLTSRAQEMGLSFSYFLPKNGYFSTPISPFSIRGVGFELSDYIALQTGATLYRMSGLNMTGLPFKSKKPLIGPNFTVMVPLELALVLEGRSADFNLKGGVFGFFCIDNKLNEGNIDRALRDLESWDVVNSDFSIKNAPGFGYHFGAEYIYYFRRFGLSIEGNYFIGGAKTGLKGSYTGGNRTGPLTSKDIDYTEAGIDYTGLEISLGILFGN